MEDSSGQVFYFTDLFLILFLVETTDIIFAMDSIPAAFAISQSPFIVFTSNIFAVMGLRALFFVLEGLLHKFHHLQKGLAIILLFIGAKMLLGWFDVHFSSYSSFIFYYGGFGCFFACLFSLAKKSLKIQISFIMIIAIFILVAQSLLFFGPFFHLQDGRTFFFGITQAGQLALTKVVFVVLSLSFFVASILAFRFYGLWVRAIYIPAVVWLGTLFWLFWASVFWPFN